MNIAVCEDNADEREAICAYMKAYCERNCFESNLRVFNSGETLLSAFTPGAFDLVFLDIFMPGLNGVDTAKKIRETDPDCALIFTTVSNAHALDAFSVQALGYVTKPIESDRIEKALRLCRELFARSGRLIEVKSEYQTIQIPARHIVYAEVYAKCTVLHMINGDTVKTYTPLDEIEEKLGVPFLRCHRSYLVNMKYVKDAQTDSFLMQNGDSVPLRQSKRSELKMALGKFKMETAFKQ